MSGHQLLEAAAIHQTHTRLLGDLTTLEQRLSSHATHLDVHEVQHLLSVVLGDIANEFSLQELDGYTSPVLDETPHLRQIVRELINDHRRLLKEFTELVCKAEHGFDDPLRLRIRRWIRALQVHENRDQKFLDDVMSYEQP